MYLINVTIAEESTRIVVGGRVYGQKIVDYFEQHPSTGQAVMEPDEIGRDEFVAIDADRSQEERSRALNIILGLTQPNS